MAGRMTQPPGGSLQSVSNFGQARGRVQLAAVVNDRRVVIVVNGLQVQKCLTQVRTRRHLGAFKQQLQYRRRCSILLAVFTIERRARYVWSDERHCVPAVSGASN